MRKFLDAIRRLFPKRKASFTSRYRPERHYMRGPGPATVLKAGSNRPKAASEDQ